MNPFSDAFTVSTKGLAAQAQRLRIVAENIANTDTPGYHRKLISFDTALTPDQPDRRDVSLSLDRSDLRRVFDPSHPLADATGSYDGSNVDLIVEVADAREAQRSYEANLKMFDQARKMSSGLLDLLRR